MEKSVVAELQCGGNGSSVVALPWSLVATLSVADVDLDHTSSPTPPLPLACVNLIIISIVTNEYFRCQDHRQKYSVGFLTIMQSHTYTITTSSSKGSN